MPALPARRAARDAVPHGYHVIVPDDACATRDLDGRDGALLPRAMLHRAALVTIADTIGDVMSTDSILALPLA
ncbi:nicotinamidase-related amidase [Oxalobacteraceae bacterium GrIS 1.11]